MISLAVLSEDTCTRGIHYGAVICTAHEIYKEYIMKSWRERYFEDYTPELVPAKNKKGYKVAYTYTGNWYSWSEESGALKKRRIIYITAAAATTVLFIICGIQNAFINTYGVVAIPGIVSIVTQMYEWIGIIQFCLSKKEIREKDCKQNYARIRKFTTLTAVCHALSALFGIGLLIWNGMELKSMFVLLGLILCFLLSLFIRKYHKTLSYIKVLEPDIMFDEMPYE